MTMHQQVDLLITGISQLATAKGSGPKHGAAMRDLDVTAGAAVAVRNGFIAWVGRARDWSGQASTTIDMGGRAVVSALVDPHTHAVWAGDRLADFEARTSGRATRKSFERAAVFAAVFKRRQLQVPKNWFAWPSLGSRHWFTRVLQPSK